MKFILFSPEEKVGHRIGLFLGWVGYLSPENLQINDTYAALKCIYFQIISLFAKSQKVYLL